MNSFGRFAIIAWITCLGVMTVGCGQGPRNGIPIAGCPDSIVEYLVVSDSGVIEPREGNFLEIVDRKDQKLVMVDFGATWCGYCTMLAPHLDRIRKDWGDQIEVVKVDIDLSPEIAKHLGVGPIPDVRIFRNGTQVGSFAGLMPRQEIEALLKSLQ